MKLPKRQKKPDNEPESKRGKSRKKEGQEWRTDKQEYRSRSRKQREDLNLLITAGEPGSILVNKQKYHEVDKRFIEEDKRN